MKAKGEVESKKDGLGTRGESYRSRSQLEYKSI